MRRNFPLQQHHRLHERHRSDYRGHDDRPPLRGLFPLRGCVQHQPGIQFTNIKSNSHFPTRGNLLFFLIFE